MTTLSVGFWNIGPAKSVDMLTRLVAVLGLAEGSDQKKMLKAFTVTNPGWAYYCGMRSGAAAVPVLVNTTVTGLPFRVTFHRAVGRRRVGPKGAGPTWSKPKWITHVEFDDGTHVLNTHMIPSATRTRKNLGQREYLARRRHFRDHIRTIVELVMTLDGPVVLTLDLNAEVDFDLVGPLHAVGFTGWTTEGTHGKRAIDHVLHLRGRGIETEHDVLRTSSDHKAVVATFEFPTEEPPMGRYPGANWRPVARYLPGGSSNQKMARYDVAVVHIEDGTWSPDEAFRWYNTPGKAIPHFRLHVPTATIDQYVDTAYRSSACKDGNHRCIAIEMWGLGHGDNADELPDDAAEALAQWLAWVTTTHNIPTREAGDSRPTSRGIGWHRLGIDGNFPQPPGQLLGGRVSGGEHWTDAGGKTCPTTPLIRQLHDPIIPRAIAITQGDDMPLSDEDLSKVRAIVADEVGKAVRFQIDEAQLPDPTGEKHAWSLATLLWNIKRLVEPKP